MGDEKYTKSQFNLGTKKKKTLYAYFIKSWTQIIEVVRKTLFDVMNFVVYSLIYFFSIYFS